MSPRLTRFALTAHVVASVGWLGAVLVFFGLSVVVVTSQDVQTIRGVYIAMGAGVWPILIPLAFASLITGLVQALGTKWGLFKHYWVVFKLSINVFANIVLIMYARTITLLAGMARESSISSADLEVLRGPSVLIHSSGALALLLTATALSVYKPRGITRYGWRKQQSQVATSRPMI
ncbi:MAG TPA: DUF2269 domain-containing protein [Actinomycetota bacterium]|nr:DUF2269 domain-containing protein [Actinomycetota bacterium]